MTNLPAARVVAGADTRREVVAIRIGQPFRVALLPARVCPGLAIDPYQVRQDLVDVVQRRPVFVAQAEVDRQVRPDAPVVLQEDLVSRLAHVHRRQAGLALLDGREAQEEARE